VSHIVTAQDFEDIYHTVNPDPESRAKVPIIIDGGATVTESMLTVEYLDAKYPEAGAKLFPNDPLQCFKVITAMIGWMRFVFSFVYHLDLDSCRK